MDVIPSLPGSVADWAQATLGLSLIVFCWVLATTPVYSHKVINYVMRVSAGLAGGVILWSATTGDTARGVAVSLLAVHFASLTASALAFRKLYPQGRRKDD